MGARGEAAKMMVAPILNDVLRRSCFESRSSRGMVHSFRMGLRWFRGRAYDDCSEFVRLGKSRWRNGSVVTCMESPCGRKVFGSGLGESLGCDCGFSVRPVWFSVSIGTLGGLNFVVRHEDFSLLVMLLAKRYGF